MEQLASCRRARARGITRSAPRHCRPVRIRGRTDCGRTPVVVAGADFDRVRKLNSWWSVTAWPAPQPGAPAHGLMGKRAYQSLTPKGEPFDLTFQGQTLHATPAGTLSTGAEEDSRVYLSLADFTRWTGIAPSTIEVAVAGSPAEIRAMIGTLGSTLPDRRCPARPPDRGSRGARTGQDAGYAAGLDRRHHPDCRAVHAGHADRVGLRPPQGFRGHARAGRFAAYGERVVRRRGRRDRPGGRGTGIRAGMGIAAWIGRANFHASVSPRFGIFPEVLVGSVPWRCWRP